MKNLYHSTWDHENLYTDRASKDEQLLLGLFLWNSRDIKVEWG
jgi:hypothetical protein